MKKIISLALAAVLLLGLLAGCGGDSDKADAKVEAAPEDDFHIQIFDDGTCMITTYIGSCDTTLKVPETIKGHTVVGIGSTAIVNLGLKKVILPDTVTFIEDLALSNLYNVEEIYLGKSLKTIGRNVFNMDDNLKTLTFPDGMTTFENVAFGSCYDLKEIYIPASVTEFENGIIFTGLCPSAVIVTPAGSAVEAYALENDIPVKNP